MKKIRLFIAATLALLTSCNVNIDYVDNNKAKQDTLAIGFSVYVNRGVATKAGEAGVLTTDVLQGAGVGFGVFSYYGNGALYNESSKPDFMYNERVTYNNSYGKWDYHPIKYWPNEYGAEASSEAADRLSFFAYAPYVEVTPSTGVVTATGDEATTGIIGLSRNIAAGDPMVMYSSSLTPGKSVDLCWGVAKEEFTSSVDGNNNHVAAGSPYIDVIKPKTGDRLTFDFNHALAQLNVQIDADIDVESHAASSLDAGTHIYVRSVTFSGFTLRGSLNLNSNKAKGPAWYDISGTGRLNRDPVVVYDGRTDDLEAVAVDVNEVPAALNPIIIQTGSSAGVTNTAVNLFNSTEAAAPVMVIPTTGVPMKVTIVYDIETADPSLPGYLSDGTTHGISIENTITKMVQTDSGNMMLEAGKKYVIGLHLGITSVKFDATVADWDNTSYANTDLPVNTNSELPGTVSFARNGTPFTEATIWKSDLLQAPTVLVNGVATTSACSWASNNTGIATVDDSGKVTGVKAGETTISVTVDGLTAEYGIYVNEVTGIALSSDNDKSNLAVGETVKINATISNTGFGTISNYPVVWQSSRPTCITLSSGASDVEVVAIGVMPVEATIWAMVEVKYLSSEYDPNDDDYNTQHYDYYDDEEVDGSFSLRCLSQSKQGFRGYEFSSGLLKYDETNGYSLVSNVLGIVDDDSGNAPHTVHNHYHLSFIDGSKEYLTDNGASSTTPFTAYYHLLSGINTSGLPLGWMIPSNAVWMAIIEGNPESEITIGNQTISKGYAYVTVKVSETESYYGLLLFRDGTAIPATALESKNITTIVTGTTDFTDNELTVEQLQWLLSDYGCVYLPGLGFYREEDAWVTRIAESQNEGKFEGYYLSSSSGWWYLSFQEGVIDTFKPTEEDPCSLVLVKVVDN